MPINIVKVYYSLVIALYTKELVFKAVIVIFIITTAVSKWLKALLTSFIFIEVTLLNISSLKVIK